jgi:hypothetical protein
VWQEAVQPLIDAGELVAIGVVQEQHPERAALYRQWRRLPWPIWVDSLGLVGLEVVPVPLLLDEAGIVRATGRDLGPADSSEALRAAIRAAFAAAPGAPDVPADWNRVPPLAGAPAHAGPGVTGGGALDFLHYQRGPGSEGALVHLERAVVAFEHELESASGGPSARFRLGVALRTRAESAARRPGDAQRAVVLWQEALAARPSQYIWRRRLQQYGPRSSQPYSFYDWIHAARAEVLARGEVPVQLLVEPRGAELADPRDKLETAPRHPLPDPDPEGKVPRDSEGWTSLDVTATPARIRPGDRVRLRLSFRVDSARAHWNNESDPLRVHLALPEGLELVAGDLEAPQPAEAESGEERVLEVELQIAGAHPAGEQRLAGYALFYACDTVGVCRYLRRDFEAHFAIDPAAARIR